MNLRELDVEARVLCKPVSGVGNFLRNVLIAFSSFYPEIRFNLYINDRIHEDYIDIVQLNNICIKKNRHPFFKNSFIWLLFYFPFVIRNSKNIIWFPATDISPFTSGKHNILLTIHDVVAEKYRNTMSWKNRVAQWLFSRKKAIRKASLYWTVSKYTKEEIMKLYGVDGNKIFVGSSIQPDFFYNYDETSKELARLRLSRKLGFEPSNKVLLFVGSIEPRKNLRFLLSIFPKLMIPDTLLIIVGKNSWGELDLNQFDLSRVIFANNVSNEELRDLYNISSCFISTSLNEGFGMPQLEAIYCHCPVISPANSAMIEVVENAGTLIMGWEEKIWIERIEELLHCKYEKCDSIFYSKKSEFSWERICKNLVNFLEKSLST